MEDISSKSRLTTTLLAVFLGVFGIHRFYLERNWDKIWDKLYDKYKPVYGGSEIAIGIHIGVIMNFVRAIKKDDIVVIPDMARERALIGRVTGNYEYKDSWEDDLY